MNLVRSFRENLNTFYEPSSGRKTWKGPYGRVLIASVFLFVLRIDIGDAFLSALISVLGVLLGFCFSVQFFIAGTDALKMGKSEYLEDLGDKRSINKLGEEIYSNIVYLNFAILTSIIVSLSLLITTPTIIRKMVGNPHLFQMIGQALFWLTATEVLSTFLRCLSRSSLFFSERRRLLDGNKDETGLGESCDAGAPNHN